ncbi:hypothetical protein [Spirosoma rhododendri]|uniref:Uncharacterized protein n=1 Tax=Spirosoma rhododendri TaxID=2728024 RepID=A0A7L5DR86_9BACT|nr:hypothetical protein [Spirosoma rhododendri]QJD79068.1 hypothetical protein HH216_12020 [Spirosoma rhododendri]
MTRERRNMCGLVILLLCLLLPICFVLWHGDPPYTGLTMGMLVFGSAVSGPGLILYGLLTYHFSAVTAKTWLATVATLIGLLWTGFVLYTAATTPD